MTTRDDHEEAGKEEPETAGTRALSVVESLLNTISANEEGTRRGEDPEALHDMRVATRRMRAALREFEAVLPPELSRLRDEYEWLGRLLGEVRDLDVQIESLQATDGLTKEWRDGLNEVIAATRRRREGCRVLMLDALDSERYKELLSGTRGALAAPVPPAGDEPLAPFAVRAMRRAHRRLRRTAGALGPDAPDAAFHETRKKARGLRYTVEFMLPLFEGEASKLIRALVELQDQLGAHQDRVASSQLLGDIAFENQNRMSVESLLLTGRLIENKQAGLATLRNQAPSTLKRIRRRWRSLRREMRHG